MEQIAVMDIDLYHHNERIRRQLEMLEQSKGLEANKQAVRDFVNFCREDPNIGDARIARYIYDLRKISSLAGKPFKKLTEKDLLAILAKIRETPTWKGTLPSPRTMADYRKTVSKYWRWLFYDECKGDAPLVIRRIKAVARQGYNEPEIFSKEEIVTLIGGMTSIRDKAFFSMLYDLEARVGELLTRRIKHLNEGTTGDMEITIESTKTGVKHEETLFESVPYLTSWLRMHPDPNNPEAPLFVMKTKGKIVPLSYPAARKAFVTCCKRNKVRHGKRNHIHMIRRSKATHDMLDGVPMPYIESRGSWSKGSRALQKCYLSVVKKDKNAAYKKKYNMLPDIDDSPTEMKQCKRCHAPVENNARFCGRCGFSADMKTAVTQQFINENISALISKEQLSELVKQFIVQSIENGDKEIIEAAARLRKTQRAA